ncbi:hypothetical protein GCM10010967_53200 [Dyadobacter beijingensis]|uniref:Uncharacterized protein n=1 Tax=Dyadobacter beijingensis TaxID=365489 RepID=A0ABQ2IKN4_9BACT|nr:hypothetical protein [Dyadobacter beijingensis]GGN10663.1 hypothetical protein GCM10010967_53200 [Dyadobacter beijingensis]
MKYLIVDASFNGTGIRDQYNGGYLHVTQLQLTTDFIDSIKSWLARYDIKRRQGFNDSSEIDRIDAEGKENCRKIKSELVDAEAPDGTWQVEIYNSSIRRII